MGVSKSRRPIIAPNSDDIVQPVGGGGYDFDTSEVDTGRKWVDGKTIFSKVVTTSGNFSTGTTSIAHGLDFSTVVDRVVELRGNVKRDLNSEIIPVPYAASAGLNWMVAASINDTNVQVAIGSLWTGAGSTLSDGIFIIEYTKQ